MKTLLISAAAAVLLLSACSNSKKAEEMPNAAPQISVEEAMSQCQQSAGANADRVAFDACMKDKGFQRKEAQAPAAAPAK